MKRILVMQPFRLMHLDSSRAVIPIETSQGVCRALVRAGYRVVVAEPAGLDPLWQDWHRRLECWSLAEAAPVVDGIVALSTPWNNLHADVPSIAARIARWCQIIASGKPVVVVQEDPHPQHLFPASWGLQRLAAVPSRKPLQAYSAEIQQWATKIPRPVTVLCRSKAWSKFYAVHTDYRDTAEFECRVWNPAGLAFNRQWRSIVQQPATRLVYLGHARFRETLLRKYYWGLPVTVYGRWTTDAATRAWSWPGVILQAPVPVGQRTQCYSQALATVSVPDRRLVGYDWQPARIYEAPSHGCPVFVAHETWGFKVPPPWREWTVYHGQDVTTWYERLLNQPGARRDLVAAQCQRLEQLPETQPDFVDEQFVTIIREVIGA